MTESNRTRALSFAGVADAYDRSRPDYPEEAVRWLVGGRAGDPPRRVLELGAGTGKLTAGVGALGHQVVATDPLPEMLDHLRRRAPQALAVAAPAERIPLPARSVDVVLAGQSFHWFDLDRALPEIARVLRPGGRLALAWNVRDERIPWVRRLEDLLGPADRERDRDPTQSLIASQLFGYVEQTTVRFWQPLGPDRLRDLARSVSHVATMTETARERALAAVDDLYAEYGRGHDGMLLPYLTRCFAATVRAPAVPEDPPTEPQPGRDPSRSGGSDGDDGGDAGSLLIDFT